MEQENYKQEIEQTRKGCLGGSDAAMLRQVAQLGNVPRSAYKRLAVCKGLVDSDHVVTRAMQYGDYIEQSIYRYLTETGKAYQSNPLWVSEKYSKKNVKLICHPDFVCFDDEKKCITVYECKATKFNPKATQETYRPQMFIEWLLAKEVASKLGNTWKVKIKLVHYDSSEQDMEGEFVFDTSKLSVVGVGFTTKFFFDIDKAMNIVDEYLENLDVYVEDDEIESEYLPAKVKEEFEMITNILTEIKEREKKVEDFKQKLYAFMLEKNVKGIRSEEWSITRVDSSESVQFDYRRFLDEYMYKHPIKAKKLLRTYEKRVKRKGYAVIKLVDKTK